MTSDGRSLIRHGDMTYEFPSFGTLAQWQAHREHLRRRILTAAGLWPTPERGALNVRVTGHIEHDDYTIENVYFESYPGFFVGGNLYRPKGKVGPFPGVLCPHGHWEHGRVHDAELGSIPARCISFARQGYVAFAYDMVGYNDSGVQVPHRGLPDETGGFWDEPRHYLWGVSLLGQQLWNSIRATDFIEALPDVDPRRLACTGASGGGTQTFLLTAVDERIQVSAPVNMISAHMQGGCLCENAPNLRLDTFNVEIGAMMAPRPMLMVSATGDWTRNTPSVEYPAIRSIYRLYGAEERLEEHQVDAQHNYNKESREAVYTFFGKWLLGETDAAKLREQPYAVDAPERMLAFQHGKLPANAVTPERLVADLAAERRGQVESMRPVDAASLQGYRETMGATYRYALNLATPAPGDLVTETDGEDRTMGHRRERFTLGTRSGGERIPAVLAVPEDAQAAVLVVHPGGKDAVLGQKASPLAGALLGRGLAVLALDVFGVGEATVTRDSSRRHFHTFNRTDAALRLQDIITAIAYLRRRYFTVQLVGEGEAGLWCLLARALAPEVATTVVDAAQFDCESDALWTERLYLPGIRRAGDLKTAAALIAPGELVVHNAAASFPSRWYRQIYDVDGAGNALRIEPDALNVDVVVGALA